MNLLNEPKKIGAVAERGKATAPGRGGKEFNGLDRCTHCTFLELRNIVLQGQPQLFHGTKLIFIPSRLRYLFIQLAMFTDQTV
jgi:hypothetical protein